MTILQLTYMIELARTGSFSIAARQLEISQPALSMQISKLEEELEVRLFHRSPTKIRLSREGEKFIEQASEILQLFERLKFFSLEMENRPAGSLTIGIIPTLAPYWVPHFAGNFIREYPRINLSLREMLTSEIISGLKDGSLDAGFLSTPVETVGIDFKPLFYEQFFLYVSEGHHLANADVVDLNQVDLEQVWYLEEGNCFQNQVNSVCRYKKEPDDSQSIIYRSNSIESLCRMVDSGKGMTFIPELATMGIPSEREEMIKSIAAPIPFREISLATIHHPQSDFLVGLLVQSALRVIPVRMKKRPDQLPVNTQLKV